MKEVQGRDLVFRNGEKETFEWSDEVSIDNPEIQGLLEQDAPFPELSAELPDILLKGKIADGPKLAVQDKPELDKEKLATLALKEIAKGLSMT